MQLDFRRGIEINSEKAQLRRMIIIDAVNDRTV